MDKEQGIESLLEEIIEMANGMVKDLSVMLSKLEADKTEIIEEE